VKGALSGKVRLFREVKKMSLAGSHRPGWQTGFNERVEGAANGRFRE